MDEVEDCYLDREFGLVDDSSESDGTDDLELECLCHCREVAKDARLTKFTVVSWEKLRHAAGARRDDIWKKLEGNGKADQEVRITGIAIRNIRTKRF